MAAGILLISISGLYSGIGAPVYISPAFVIKVIRKFNIKDGNAKVPATKFA
jgi:hypothetical protein